MAVDGSAAADAARRRSVSMTGSGRAAARILRPSLHAITRFGLYIALLVAIAVFGALRPDAFLTVTNALSILTLAAPLMIVSLGLTIALVMNEIDLSIGSMMGLAGAFCVVLMSHLGVPWPLAMLCTVLLAVAVGITTGTMVTHGGANSLIISLGMATFLTGIEFTLTNQRTIYTGIDEGFIALGQSEILGLNAQIWIAGILALICFLALEKTEMGRYMYATGSNAEACRLAGVPVRTLRISAFVFSALGAAMAGLLLTAQSASSFVNVGLPYLLPAFAAAFLGSTVSPKGQFTVAGTVAAVLFIGVIQSGLTMLQLSTGSINLSQGGMLIAAVLLSRLGQRSGK